MEHNIISHAAWQKKKDAKEQLEQVHTSPNSIPGVVERLTLVEKVIGIKESD